MRLYRPVRCLALALPALIAGCQTVQSVSDSLNCTVSYCQHEYPKPALQTNTGDYDAMLVLPPMLALTHKALNGEETVEDSVPEGISPDYADAIARPGQAYQIDLSPLAHATDQQHADILRLHNALWPQQEDPKALIAKTPLFHSPQVTDPVATSQVPVPASLKEAAGDRCCLLVMKMSGWVDNEDARSAKWVTALFTTLLSGISTMPDSMGAVITDIAVVRADDGRILWSAQSLADGNSRNLTLAMRPYFSTVYNAKAMP